MVCHYNKNYPISTSVKNKVEYNVKLLQRLLSSHRHKLSFPQEMPTVIYKTGSKFHQLFVSNFFKFSLDIYTLSIKSFATKY